MEDGRTMSLRPANGVSWSLGELQTLVGGFIEVVQTVEGHFMVINEMGKVRNPPMDLNIPATRLYKYGRLDVILGPAVVIETLEEMDRSGGD
jgi:hypothetical protein